MTDVALKLTPRELELIKEALDSHEYWQLSDQHYRENGYVLDQGSDDPEAIEQIKEVRALAEKLEKESDRPKDPWSDDSIQFPRLIAEISATQEMLDIKAIATSMDLDLEDVDELFDRADARWEEIKKSRCYPKRNSKEKL